MSCAKIGSSAVAEAKKVATKSSSMVERTMGCANTNRRPSRAAAQVTCEAGAPAALAGLVMAYAIDRIERRGAVLLWSVAAYGAATVIFGLSRSFWLTLLCLAGVGAADTVSTVIRNIVRQLETPDELRGRMTGVNMIFFMGGPQLGELEAGVAAQLFGAVASVVSGGIGCLIATAVVARHEERLRQYRR